MWLYQVTCNSDVADRLKVLRRGMEKKINLRKYDDESVSELVEALSYVAKPLGNGGY